MAQAKTDSAIIPAFEVRINGRPLAPADESHVVALTVEHDVGLPGMFTLQLAGADDQAEDIPWIDDANLFAIGNVIEMKLGYGDHLESVIVGEITGLEPEFGRDRRPNLTVRGFDRLHRLQRGRKTRTFVSQKDSDVAAQIANDAGLTPDVEDSGVQHDYLVQANQTDLEFLAQRAARIRFEVRVEDKTLKFGPAQNAQSPLVTLSPGDGLLEFHPRLTSIGQASEVSVRGWSVKDKKEIVGRARAGDQVSTMGGNQTGPALVERAFGSAIESVTTWPTTTQAEADQAAKARLNHLALGLIAGEGVCAGRTDLRSSGVIGIEGVGRRFGGRYYVTGVRHRYESERGYETRFTVRRNAS